MVPLDRKFEMEYIISLTVIILTFLTADSLKELLDLEVAFIFLILVALHIILFNSAYMFSKASKFEIPSITKIDKSSQWTFVIVLMGFIFVIFHMICKAITKIIFGERKILICEVDIAYIVPFIIVVIIMFPLYKKIIHPIFLFRKIEIATSPDGTRIFPDFEDTEPLFIKIENTSNEKLPFTVEIDFPKGVIYKDKLEGKNKYSDEITVSPKSVKMYHIDMKYDGDKRKSDLINIIMSSETKRFKKNVYVMLEKS